MAGLAERLADVRRRIADVGGEDRAITIVAVTKGFGIGAVDEAFQAGLRDFGENYAQSLLAKVQESKNQLLTDVRWHFVGGIQRRKVAGLSPHVDLWQSVARREEGQEIERRAPGAAVMVQVNVSGRPERNGCSWHQVSGLVDFLRGEGLEVHGLMGMASRDDPRPQFRRLADLAKELGLPQVSMGMSQDFEVAVEEGATMVRLGTVLFGPRPEPSDLRR